MKLAHMLHAGSNKFMLRGSVSQTCQATLSSLVFCTNLREQPCYFTSLLMSSKHGFPLLLASKSVSKITVRSNSTYQEIPMCLQCILLVSASEKTHTHSMHDNTR